MDILGKKIRKPNYIKTLALDYFHTAYWYGRFVTLSTLLILSNDDCVCYLFIVILCSFGDKLFEKMHTKHRKPL